MRQLICWCTYEWLQIRYTYKAVRISKDAHIDIGCCKITACYNWPIALIPHAAGFACPNAVAFTSIDIGYCKIMVCYWREEMSTPLSVEFDKILLYLFIYIFGERKRAHPCLLNYSNFCYIYLYIYLYVYIYIYFRSYVVHVLLTRNAQTSDRPVEVQRLIWSPLKQLIYFYAVARDRLFLWGSWSYDVPVSGLRSDIPKEQYV